VVGTSSSFISPFLFLLLSLEVAKRFRDQRIFLWMVSIVGDGLIGLKLSFGMGFEGITNM